MPCKPAVAVNRAAILTFAASRTTCFRNGNKSRTLFCRVRCGARAKLTALCHNTMIVQQYDSCADDSSRVASMHDDTRIVVQ